MAIEVRPAPQFFEDEGFSKAADTVSVDNGYPRILMRLDLCRAG